MTGVVEHAAPATAAPWSATFPDGTALPTVTGGTTPRTATTVGDLTGAANGSLVTYTGPPLSTLTIKGRKDCTFHGLRFAAGATFELKDCENVVVEPEMPYQLADGKTLLKISGRSRDVAVRNFLLGPPAPVPAGSGKCNFIVVGGDADRIELGHGEIRNKSIGGNGFQVDGVSDREPHGGATHVHIHHLYVHDIGPFTANDHEPGRLGESAKSRTATNSVVEFCRFERCRSEPEVVSLKMCRIDLRGCTFVDCIGGPVLRHGDDSRIHDCYLIGDAQADGHRTGGVRGYGVGHEVHHNYIRVNGSQKHECALILDTADAETGSSTLNKHFRVERWKVHHNLIVDSGSPIVVGNNYAKNPRSCSITDNVVAGSGPDAIRFVGGAQLEGTSEVARNAVFGSAAAAGLTQDGDGVWRRAGADLGPRVPLLTAAMVGRGGAHAAPPSTGATPATPVTPVHPTGPATPTGAGLPADVLDLRGWKLTLPIPRSEGSEKPLEIKPSKLVRYERDPYFVLNEAGDGVVFHVNYGGITTDGSDNPRCELREMDPDGDDDDEAEWSMKSGVHEMTVVGQVNRLTPKRPHTVLAQIHGGDDDITVWRVEGTQLWITKGDHHDDWHEVTDHFRLGERYTLRFRAANKKVEYWYNGTKVDFTVASSDSSCFFKAGAYLQSNSTNTEGESTRSFTEVVIYDLRVTHS